MSKQKDAKRLRRGDIVFWMDSPTQVDTHLATVLEVGDEAMTVLIMNTMGVFPRDGVRHWKDPVLKDPERATYLLQECGCYRTKEEEYALEDERIEREQMRELERLEREAARNQQLATA